MTRYNDWLGNINISINVNLNLNNVRPSIVRCCRYFFFWQLGSAQQVLPSNRWFNGNDDIVQDIATSINCRYT